MFSGLTRSERWILLGFVVVIGIGLGANQLRDARRERVFQLVEGGKPRELTHTPPPPDDAIGRAPVPRGGEKINLNTATATELQRLEGIGEKKAQTIIEDRRVRGPFLSVDDLDRVKGFGPATLEKLRPYLTVGEAAAPAEPEGAPPEEAARISPDSVAPGGNLAVAPLGPLAGAAVSAGAGSNGGSDPLSSVAYSPSSTSAITRGLTSQPSAAPAIEAVAPSARVSPVAAVPADASGLPPEPVGASAAGGASLQGPQSPASSGNPPGPPLSALPPAFIAPPSAGSPPPVAGARGAGIANASQAAGPGTGKVNINTAGIEELKRLEGIGDVKAKAIVEYRQTFGRFRRADDLMKVKGIGPKTLEKNRHLITVD